MRQRGTHAARRTLPAARVHSSGVRSPARARQRRRTAASCAQRRSPPAAHVSHICADIGAKARQPRAPWAPGAPRAQRGLQTSQLGLSSRDRPGGAPPRAACAQQRAPAAPARLACVRARARTSRRARGGAHGAAGGAGGAADHAHAHGHRVGRRREGAASAAHTDCVVVVISSRGCGTWRWQIRPAARHAPRALGARPHTWGTESLLRRGPCRELHLRGARVRARAYGRASDANAAGQQRPMRSLVTTAASARRALAAAATALALVVFIAPGALLPLRGAAALRLVPAGGHLHSLPAPRRRTELHAATLELRVDESSPPIAAPLGPSPIGFSMEYGPEVRASGRGLAGRSRRST